MTPIFEYVLIPEWPPLVWLAQCRQNESSVIIFHGPRVEIADDWFCEAIWDGCYEAGDLDRTDLVFGSGCRAREDHLIFVSSATTADRLQWITIHRSTWISNSLACLMAVTDAEFDPIRGEYHFLTSTAAYGLHGYRRSVPTSAGPIEFAYFHNVLWNGEAMRRVDKAFPRRKLTTFDEYHAFLVSSLTLLRANMESADRRRSLSWVGTLSSGYDSPAVAVLGKECGLKTVICVEESRSGNRERGVEIAMRLGLEAVVVNRDSWRRNPEAEVPFLIGHGGGGDFFLESARNCIEGRVLLSGDYGDQIWGKLPFDLGEEVVRRETGGLGSSEFRLWAGFISCPVPFFAARQVRDVHAISISEEMKPWDVLGSYSRPIPRRIVENASVPRDWFGQKKDQASVLYLVDSRLTGRNVWKEYSTWVQGVCWKWIQTGRIPPGKSVLALRQGLASFLIRCVSRAGKLCRRRDSVRLTRTINWISKSAVAPYLRFLLWWCIERARPRFKVGPFASEGASIDGEPAALTPAGKSSRGHVCSSDS